MSQTGSEKRQLPRLLCADGFSGCRIEAHGDTFDLDSLNYTREGIALFRPQALPDFESFTLSFSYQMGAEMVAIQQLPCTLVHMMDEEGGVIYGATFDLPACSPEQIDDLIRIEEHMARSSV